MPTRIDISPEKLIWAAERGGLSMNQLVDVFPKAKDWIEKKSVPTVKQLEAFSQKVHIPFGFLFLDKTPNEKLPITFYRGNGDVIENPSIAISDLVNDIKRKQDWLKDYLIENNYDNLDFVGKLKGFSNFSVEKASEILRDYLNISDVWYEKTNKKSVFRYWIDKIEKSGIIVISTGFVKNNRRTIDVDICKGFTLVDDHCPFIYINTNNLGGGKIFTIIHELVHVFVGNSIGIGYDPIHPSSEPLEKFCDSVASEVLVPQKFFETAWNSYSESPISKFTTLSNQFHVSKLVIARKALDSKYVSRSQFWDFYNSYTKTFSGNNSNGGNYWNSKPYEVSRKFYEHVDSALNMGKILPSNAYRLTNMKGATYDNFKKQA